MTYRTPLPARGGELLAFCIYFIVFGVIFTLLLWMGIYFAYQALGWNWNQNGDLPQMILFLFCVLMGFAGALWISRVRLWWTVTLQRESLRLGGRWIGMEIPYEFIELINAHAVNLHNPLALPVLVPLAVHLGGRKRFQVWLRPSDAAACCAELRVLCRWAGTIDPNGIEHLPSHRERIPQALLRIGKARRATGWAGIAVGLVLVLHGVLALAALRGAPPQKPRAAMLLHILLIPPGIAGLWVGVRLVRRGSKFTRASAKLAAEANLSSD